MMLFFVILSFLGAALFWSGVVYTVIECGLFLWVGRWLSPVDALALVKPDILDRPWVVEPHSWRGVHIIVTSPFGGVIVLAVGLLIAIVFGYIATELEHR